MLWPKTGPAMAGPAGPPTTALCTITHVPSPLIFLQLNNIGINATELHVQLTATYATAEISPAKKQSMP